MNQDQTKYHRNLPGARPQGTATSSHEMFDPFKLKIILKKNIPWVLLIILVAISVAFLYIRYTNVKYRSVAELKLNKRNEATVFGFNPLSEENSNLSNLSGEVELIRSKLFLNEVIKQLPLDVTYEVIGRFKNEERYHSIPFQVMYDKETVTYGKNYYVDILNEVNFRFSTDPESGQWTTLSFGEAFIVDGCPMRLVKTPDFFTSQMLFFRVNNMESRMEYIESNLSVAPENLNANTIKITFEDYNPFKVQSIVEKISELYTEYSREQKVKASELKIAFLDEQLSKTEKVLSDYEAYIENFTIKNKTASPADDISRMISEMSQIDSALFDLNCKIATMSTMDEQLSKDSIAIETINSQLLPSFIREKFITYTELKLEYDVASMRYKFKSQVLQQKAQEMQQLREQLHNAIVNRIEILKDQKEVTLERRQEIEREFRGLPSKLNDLNQNKRFYTLYEGLYLSLVSKKTEFQIAMAGTLAEVVILTPANLPKTPIGPNSATLYAGAFGIGFLISFFLIAVNYLLYDEINSIRELEQLTTVPVVAKISKLSKSIARKSGVIVQERPRSQISEAFRTLRTSLDFVGIKEGKKVISVSSTTSGEGKTFISVNLAAILAISSKKVVILDLDMRKPRAQYAFNVTENELGVSSILSGSASWQECVSSTKTENLHFIPSGIIPPNPAELLESNRFDQLLESLKQEYDIILLDTPPIGLLSDGIIAIKKSDHSLFVVRADYSKRSFLSELHRNMHLNNIQRISIVFNAIRKEGKGYGYYQDYYSDNRSKSLSTLKKLFNL